MLTVDKYHDKKKQKQRRLENIRYRNKKSKKIYSSLISEYIFIEFLDAMLSYKFLGPHCDSDAEALRHVRVRKVIHLKNDTSAASKLMNNGLLSF